VGPEWWNGSGGESERRGTEGGGETGGCCALVEKEKKKGVGKCFGVAFLYPCSIKPLPSPSLSKYLLRVLTL
jgi:hypothetical protein